MEATVALTSRWQLYIPNNLRGSFGPKKPAKVRVVAKNGGLVVTPIKKSILDLAGSLHHLYKKNPIDVNNIRDYIDYSKA